METTSRSTSPASQSILSRGQHMLEGIRVQFPQFKHEHHSPIVNVNEAADKQLTMGQRIADGVASTVGSWPFIITQSCILACWLVLNSLAWINHWDPYPFILLNLALSFQAAYAAPFVMMSQNRQATKDRLTAENDYKTDVKGEREICHIMEHLDHQDTLIIQMVQQLQVQTEKIGQQEGQILQIVQQLQAQNQLLTSQDNMILQVTERLETQHEQLKEQREELLQRMSNLPPNALQGTLHEMDHLEDK
jgi:uncharacterized membrane protein